MKGIIAIAVMVLGTYYFFQYLEEAKKKNAENAARIIQLRQQQEREAAQSQNDGQPVDVSAAKATADKIARCEANKPTFAKWIGELCDASTKLTPADMCGLHHTESEMCMGTEAGEVCKPSAKKAAGPFQFMPATFYGETKPDKKGRPVKHPGMGIDGDGDGKLDINGFADAGKSSVRYLCLLEKKVGSADMFRAYNGGIEGYKDAVTATTEYDKTVRARSLTYSSGSSGSAPVFAQGAYAGPDAPLTVQAIGAEGKLLTVGRSSRVAFPIAIGDGCVSSIQLEPRPGGRLHDGNDYAAEIGIPVFAAADGIVRHASWNHSTPGGERAGIHVRIEHNGTTKTPGTLAYTGSMHLNDVTVSVGQQVKQGQLIGHVGRTAVYNSGSHLHYQLEKWTAGGNTEQVEIPGEFLDLSAYDPSSSLYRGPKTEGCQTRGEKFSKFVANNP